MIRDSILHHLKCALLDDDQFLLRMIVCCVRRLAGIERGDVAVESVERGGASRDRILTPCAGLRWLDFETAPFEDG